MTKLLTFPNGETLVDQSPKEAAENVNLIHETNFQASDAVISEEPGDDEFEAKYGEPVNQGKTVCGNPHLLETFGEELEKAIRIAQTHPKRIWTIVDGDDGVSRLIPGLHLVNRINFLQTKKDWEDESESYVWG